MKKDFPKRTKKLLVTAKSLENKHIYIPAMLLYCEYLEQALLSKYLIYLREDNPSKAKEKMDEIMRLKDRGKLTFGKTLEVVKPILTPEANKLSREIKRIRNHLVAHPFFVIRVDPTNKYKLGFYDVGNYRKVIRRIYNLIKNENYLTQKEHNKIKIFLKLGHPLTKLSRIEQESEDIEDILLKKLCVMTRKKVIGTVAEPLYGQIKKGGATYGNFLDF